jgi:hypothetical protein
MIAQTRAMPPCTKATVRSAPGLLSVATVSAMDRNEKSTNPTKLSCFTRPPDLSLYRKSLSSCAWTACSSWTALATSPDSRLTLSIITRMLDCAFSKRIASAFS